MNKNNEKDYENLKEIVDLCKEELEKNDENTTAILDIADLRSLNNILSEYKRLKQENEELKGRKQNIEPVLIGNKMYFIDKGLYEDLLNDIKNNYIPVQKVKEKIEEYKNMCISNAKGYGNYFKDNYDEFVFRRMKQLEKELLESEEEK